MNIFFETKTVTTIQESPKYTLGDLLNDLGGAFSLYLGVSFIALFEIFEIFIRCANKGMNRRANMTPVEAIKVKA